MITRVKGIITDPKREWAVIAGEHTPHAKVFMGYVLPLSLIPAIAAFIGYGLIGFSVLGVQIHSISWGIRYAIFQWVVTVGGIYGLYLLYIGIQPMMRAPSEKNTNYFIVSLIVTIVVSLVFSAVFTAILIRSYFF